MRSSSYDCGSIGGGMIGPVPLMAAAFIALSNGYLCPLHIVPVKSSKSKFQTIQPPNPAALDQLTWVQQSIVTVRSAKIEDELNNIHIKWR